MDRSHPEQLVCAQCGAPVAPHSCAELFQTLLALDHSRREPWGPLHAVSVSCYLLQHHDGSDDVSVRYEFLQGYVDGGLRSVRSLTDRARRANSHRSPGPPPPVARGRRTTPPVGPFALTIADVAEDGDFPAQVFEERLSRWATATLSA